MEWSRSLRIAKNPTCGFRGRRRECWIRDYGELGLLCSEVDQAEAVGFNCDCSGAGVVKLLRTVMALDQFFPIGYFYRPSPTRTNGFSRSRQSHHRQPVLNRMRKNPVMDKFGFLQVNAENTVQSIGICLDALSLREPGHQFLHYRPTRGCHQVQSCLHSLPGIPALHARLFRGMTAELRPNNCALELFPYKTRVEDTTSVEFIAMLSRARLKYLTLTKLVSWNESRLPTRLA